MERLLSENNDLPTSALLESMLRKLTTNQSPKTHNVQSHEHPDTGSQHMSHHSMKLDGQTTGKEVNVLDSTIKSEVDREPPTKTSETEKVNKAVEGFKEFPDVFPKWERRKLLPFSMAIQTLLEDRRDGTTSEDRKNKELGMEQPMEAGAAILHRSQKESLSLQSCEPSSDHSVSLERNAVSQTEFNNELLDESCDCPPKLCTAIGAASTLTHQTHVNVTGRAARSASDPVEHKPKEHRPLSAPSISCLREYEEFANKESIKNSGNMDKASVPTAGTFVGQKDLGKEEGFRGTDHDKSLPEIQKKRMKNKMKDLTQKVMGKLQENHNHERIGSKSSQDSAEEEAHSLSSMKMDVEAPLSPPPLPLKNGRYVFLERKFTLKDFKFNLEPINLMEEIFTGEEWLKYLPSKTSPLQKDTGDQTADDVPHPNTNTQLHVPQLTSVQNQSEDRNFKQSDIKQKIMNGTGNTISELDNVTKVNTHLHVREMKPNANIIAIPKALLTNAAIKQEASGIHHKSKHSDDIYEGIFMIPKHDFPLMEKKSVDVSLDFSTVKSSGLLDHSAQRSQIRLSKKRPYGPPKKHRKGKQNTKFYKIPSAFLTESTISSSQSSSLDCMSIAMSPPLHSNPHPAQC